ncbi:MAG TPA: thermonuclease family protein, partial [Thermomicrobiales bacterium]|nr:thermonuclease family protein [Thermomicrobiales bacterium]
NVTGSDQVFDMSTFKLLADGQEVYVDTGNQWVAGMLGYSPAYGNVDQITWAAGESHQFALTFLAPTDAQSLVLEAGDQQIDLTTSISSLSALEKAKTKPDAVVPTTIEAKVVKVVNAETILVDINGRQQEVRYLGVDAPTDTDCYAKDATAANSALVKGQTVRIERQATDVDARGNWVRDVWAKDGDGDYQLVSNSLIGEGAAKADISEPNTRFDGWLTASQADAQSQGLGLWGSCDNETPDSTVPAAPTPAAPTPAASLNGDTTAIRNDDRIS